MEIRAGVLICVMVVAMSCQGNRVLQEGRWSGSLSPGNHPEMSTPLEYDVENEGDRIVINIIGPDKSILETRDVTFTDNVLSFKFTEPEESVELTCNLTEDKDATYQGKCKDQEGKWALFKMVPPTNK